MTPYAVLLCRPADTDLTIRQRFHTLSKDQHPDRPGAEGVPGGDWYRLIHAYGLIKTEAARSAYASALRGFSALCPVCDGYGVRGSRTAGSKLRLCERCAGEGRLTSDRG